MCVTIKEIDDKIENAKTKMICCLQQMTMHTETGVLGQWNMFDWQWRSPPLPCTK